MGGSQNKAHIFVAVENNNITAGQAISCVAHLLLSKKVLNPSLEVKFSGKEWVKFQGDGIKTGKTKIVEFKTSLINPNTKILEAGSYSFPFIVDTPKAIPGTFKANMKRFEAKIAYKVRVLLKKKNKTVGKSKSEIIIEQVFDANRYSVLTNHAGTVICCDCYNKGICNITSHVDKNAYLPNETAKLWIEVDNSQSRRTLSTIGVMFWRIIRLISTDNQVGLFKKCIYSTNVDVNIHSGSKLLTGKEIKVDIPIYNKNIELDQSATTIGRIVQCRYFIEITTDFGRCMSRVVDFEVPIIVIPKFIQQPLPSAPEDWNPVEMPPMRFSVYSDAASAPDERPSAPEERTSIQEKKKILD